MRREVRILQGAESQDVGPAAARVYSSATLAEVCSLVAATWVVWIHGGADSGPVVDAAENVGPSDSVPLVVVQPHYHHPITPAPKAESAPEYLPFSPFFLLSHSITGRLRDFHRSHSDYYLKSSFVVVT